MGERTGCREGVAGAASSVTLVCRGAPSRCLRLPEDCMPALKPQKPAPDLQAAATCRRLAPTAPLLGRAPRLHHGVPGPARCGPVRFGSHMGALEQLAALLVQQHALQHPAAAASPAPAAPSGVATGQSPALPKGPFESASNGAHASGSTAQQCSSGPTGSVLGAALASLLQQRCSEPAAIQLDAMSRDSSHDFAPTAAAAVAAATNAAAAATAEDDAAHGRMLELAKAVAQVIITQVQAHPSCMALKRMGAAISETLLKCVAPSGLASLEQQQQQKEQAAAAAAAQQQEQQQNLLLAALLHPALVASAGASGGTGSIWDASHEVRSSTGSATDALLAAAINQQLQQQQQQQDKAPFRPHATRAGSDHTTDTPGAWPLLLHAAPVPHGAPRQVWWCHTLLALPMQMPCLPRCPCLAVPQSNCLP